MRLGLLIAGVATALALAVGAGRAVAKGACGFPESCPPGPPQVNVWSWTSGKHSENVRAAIYPDGYATTYELWIEYARCQGGAGECPNPPKKELLKGGTLSNRVELREVTKSVHRTTPGCTYSYWAVASNSHGAVESTHEVFTAPEGTSGPKECDR